MRWNLKGMYEFTSYLFEELVDLLFKTSTTTLSYAEAFT